VFGKNALAAFLLKVIIGSVPAAFRGMIENQMVCDRRPVPKKESVNAQEKENRQARMVEG